MALLVSETPWEQGGDERRAIARRLKIGVDGVSDYVLVRKSLDARHRKQRWLAVYRVEVRDEAGLLARNLHGVRPWTERDAARYTFDVDEPVRRGPPALPPIVVGMGPAGMFAALWLAESGAEPIVLERGGPVDERVTAVNAWWRRQVDLDPEHNLVFGEGGAGTFSDGKIYTRRRDGELGYVFRKLVQFGADESVLKEAWAHLGTDRIRQILPPLRERLAQLGAQVRFRARVTGLLVEDGRCLGVRLEDGEEIRGSSVIIATGHSARDAVQMLVDAGASAEPRGIAIGARVEHPQTLIDQATYGGERGPLPAASYRLAHNPSEGLAARSFCMCPGGVVVPANNHPERVVVNGMSFAARRAFWANSAIIVEVPASMYGADDPMAGFRWQDAIERRAFELGDRDYRAPAQRVVDLIDGRAGGELPRSSYPLGLTSTDLREVLPEAVIAGMLGALAAFDRKMSGFAGPDALLIAPETRTTSPVRFHRDEMGQSTSLRGLYPVGEGAGYAGGIVSSALDGLRTARALTH
ncbi:MAG: FAD-binding protein [Alphaproteobacteria bacterium]|nr:FAD-binding protein [Alphaproteobacteria bacterium]MCB9696192.1 FAD-binding protein [Alphaproteobacteria bacterium]